MLFNSYEFIFAFLPLTVAIFFFLSRFDSQKHSLWFLMAASLFFYGWWNPAYLILITTSLIVNFTLGTLIQKNNNAKRSQWILLLIGMIFNVGLLSYYKYGAFLVNIFNDIFNGDVSWTNAILPLAISFFTFQQIAFLVDCTSGRIKQANFLNYTLFVTFFPQLIAGPIVHHREMMPQFNKIQLSDNRKNLTIGLTIFAFGLFKKVILADSISEYVSPIYAEAAVGDITFIQTWIAGVGFTLQIYFDFSGYSDMALGAARMFGIILPMNFNSPLKATNIIDFWARWHMTLTRFLTAYIFTPLAIKATRKIAQKKLEKKSVHKTSVFLSTLAIPTIVTMFASGIWHGAGYQFIVWGTLHGCYLVINQIWRKILPVFVSDKNRYEKIAKPAGLVITLFLVCFTMLFFRADNLDTGYRMAITMLGFNGISLPEGIFVQLGALKEVLLSLGVTIDSTAGSKIVFGSLLCFSLLFIALFFPNSLDIMRNYKPALGYSEVKSGVFDLILSNRIVNIMILKINSVWGAIIGVLLAVAIMSMQQASEFLYWQF